MADAETPVLPSLAEGIDAQRPAIHQGSQAGDLYYGTSEAAADGISVASGLQSGPLSTIDACVQTKQAVNKIPSGDIDSMTAFLGPLVEAGIISASEARLGRQSPKLSKLCKIGECADQLRSKQILDHFSRVGLGGYTHLYQAAVLMDQAPDDRRSTARVEYVANLLQNELVRTRQDMLDLTRRLKQAKKGQDEAIDLDSIELAAAESDRSDVAEVSGDFDLVMTALNSKACRNLREPWNHPLPLCLRVGDMVTDDAVMIVLSKLSDFPTIENYLLPGCGFGSASARAFLVHTPNSPEVTDATLIVVAQRGSEDRANIAEIGWLLPGEAFDPFALAYRLVPGARSKLNLFASADTEGWHSIIGDENWRLADE